MEDYLHKRLEELKTLAELRSPDDAVTMGILELIGDIADAVSELETSQAEVEAYLDELETALEDGSCGCAGCESCQDDSASSDKE